MLSAEFYQSSFIKTSFRNTICVLNCLDSDQARRFVGPDLDPNCLQKLSTDDKTCQYIVACKELCNGFISCRISLYNSDNEKKMTLNCEG